MHVTDQKIHLKKVKTYSKQTNIFRSNRRLLLNLNDNPSHLKSFSRLSHMQHTLYGGHLRIATYNHKTMCAFEADLYSL